VPKAPGVRDDGAGAGQPSEARRVVSTLIPCVPLVPRRRAAELGEVAGARRAGPKHPSLCLSMFLSVCPLVPRGAATASVYVQLGPALSRSALHSI
jgi:hypothetical protein